jgi:hypothetical protein
MLLPPPRLQIGGEVYIALERVPLFLPVIGVVVVAVALPEARLVVVEQLEPAQPLGALPEVAIRNDQAQRSPVVGRERLAVGLVGEQRVLVLGLKGFKTTVPPGKGRFAA